MKIVLKGERPISWNEYYSGAHWSVRKEKAIEIHMLMKGVLMNLGFTVNSNKIFDKKVAIKITAYFKNRPLDSDNLPAKLYIDGLKGLLIKDDSYPFVGDVTVRSEIDRINPRVEIIVDTEGDKVDN